MKNYKVTFQYSETIYCANIARAESKEEVEKYYSKYAWYKVNEATEWDIKEAEMEGMPVITIERKEEKKMSKKASITAVEATENGFKVTYETGSVKKYAADKLPKTVQKWIEEHQEQEQETETEPETMTELEPETETTTEITTTEERTEPEMKQNKGHYDRALLEIWKRRERRDIFQGLETVILMTMGAAYIVAAAIVTALAAAVIWIAEHIPAMVQTGRKATSTTAAVISTTIEIVEDTAKAFAHMGRKAATVAAAVMTMVMR